MDTVTGTFIGLLELVESIQDRLKAGESFYVLFIGATRLNGKLQSLFISHEPDTVGDLHVYFGKSGADRTFAQIARHTAISTRFADGTYVVVSNAQRYVFTPVGS